MPASTGDSRGLGLTGMRSGVVNIALRAATLVGKLSLLFFLARWLPPVELGLFGLFTATVGYAVMLAGLDFYTYSQRELLRLPRSARPSVVLHHAGLMSLVYLAVLPVSMLTFAAGYMPWWIAPWFVGLLLAEHAAQEVGRMLVGMERQISAGVLFFLRQGAWIGIVLGLMWLMPTARGLALVFACWLAGCLLALALGAWLLHQEIGRPRGIQWDWAWVGRGVRTGLLFLAATLSLRGILTFDRYLFEGFAGLDMLGVYTLYAGIALAVMSFMDAGVFVFRYPRMVRAWSDGRYEAYTSEWHRLVRHTALALAPLVIGAAIAGPLVAALVGKAIYLDNVGIFVWLLIGVCLQALGMVPHYGLYAMRADGVILAAHASGLAVFLALAAFVGPAWPRLGVAAAVAGAFAWLLLFKSVSYCRLRPRASIAAPAI